MRCTILTIGTEILFGTINNTNAAFLSRALQDIGVDVMYHMSCGDNPKRLRGLIEHAYSDCDLVITTGGLGPTQDDVTKEIAAEYFGERLVEVPEEREKIVKWFAASGRTPTENNFRQALFPEQHCMMLPNPMGTACGFVINKDGKMLIALPGPPVEMRPMFSEHVEPLLLSLNDFKLYYRLIRTFDIGESELETRLLSLIEGQSDPTLATYATPFEAYLRIASKRPTREEAIAAVDEMTGKVRAIVGEHIYSEDGSGMDKVVLRELIERGLKISSAESMTGGQFAKVLTDIPGASAAFDRSLVTYSERAKMQELGVSPETLEKYGAVSEETAREMAEGLYRASGSDICISVTGIAGPDGGTDETPVGTFFVGIRYEGGCRVHRHYISRKSRANIRNGAVHYMFRNIYKTIKGLY